MIMKIPDSIQLISGFGIGLSGGVGAASWYLSANAESAYEKCIYGVFNNNPVHLSETKINNILAETEPLPLREEWKKCIPYKDRAEVFESLLNHAGYVFAASIITLLGYSIIKYIGQILSKRNPRPAQFAQPIQLQKQQTSHKPAAKARAQYRNNSESSAANAVQPKTRTFGYTHDRSASETNSLQKEWDQIRSRWTE